MSGATVGGVVGGVIGFWIGGPQGAQIGFMIGSAVGGYVDPEKIEGPKLTDATKQTAQDGIPIPFGYGTFPTSGNIIWVQPGPPTEHKKSERQGKASGPVQITYTYTRSYAIGICEGEISGLLLVKRNGKIVYEGRTDAELTALGMTATQISQARAASASFLTKCTIYNGDETQVADPTIEAWQGVGNVPGFRGLAYIVLHDDDVTELRGAIPQYEFVVCKNGTVSDTCNPGHDALFYWPLDDAAGGGVARELVAARNGTYSSGAASGPPLRLGAAASMYMDSIDDYMLVDAYASGTFSLHSYSNWTLTAYCKPTSISGGNVIKNIATYWQDEISGANGWELCLAYTNQMQPTGGLTLSSGSPIDVHDETELSVNSTAYLVMTYTSGTLRLYVNGALVDTLVGPFTPKIGNIVAIGGHGFPNASGFVGYVSDVAGYDFAFTAQDAADTWMSANNPNLVAVPDLPGAYVTRDGRVVGFCADQIERDRPVLATIVANILQRDGLTSDQYDVSQLTDLVDGYRVASEGGADSLLSPLMSAFFFDICEEDGKLKFIKRGGASALSLTMDDLAEREAEAIELERVQEAELLRKVSVGYLDPKAQFTATTQNWERRSGTVQAKGESVIGIPVVADSTTAARIAEKRGKVAWSETDKHKFSLPYKFGRVTPTTVITLTDAASVAHRIRVMQVEEEAGVLMVEAVKDRQASYTGTVTGLDPELPTFPEAPLIGPTQAVFMNLPPWREADDEVGLYVAIRGFLNGWTGSNILLSTDSGANYNSVATFTTPSTIGYTTTALEAWHSPEYPSVQTVTVWLPDAPASVDYETLLRYNNRAAIQLDTGEWEILQYQTVVANGSDSYTLSGLLRGRYATTPGAVAAGANFVLLDASVNFMQAERWMIGETLTVKAVSLGTDADANGSQDIEFDPCVSQTEWMPHFVQAARDVSDNVTVTWDGRARLGTENTPHHSQYFAGYRVTFDDGVTETSYDTTDSTYTLASAADPITVTVAALNSVTGAGPASTGIIV